MDVRSVTERLVYVSSACWEGGGMIVQTCVHKIVNYVTNQLVIVFTVNQNLGKTKKVV